MNKFQEIAFQTTALAFKIWQMCSKQNAFMEKLLNDETTFTEATTLIAEYKELRKEVAAKLLELNKMVK